MSKFYLWTGVLFTSIFILSCDQNTLSGEILKGEHLFFLNIGMLEDELDFFHRGNAIPLGKNSVFMYQGLIFIGNSLGHKIMEFSSYGDLVSLIYNSSENPRPVLFSLRQRSQQVVNRMAYDFPLNSVGDIAVSSEHILLVEDQVLPERQEFDQETGTILQHIIHRFSVSGTYIDYIGQEGIGGTPFPFIVSFELTARDDLVVVTWNYDTYNVFWYNKAGEHLFTVILNEAHLPIGKQTESIPNLAGIFPDLNKYRLYLHVNFETNESGIPLSRIYLLELADGRYSKSFDLPENVQLTLGGGGIEQVRYPYRFIGVAHGGMLFFISRSNDLEHSLVILDSMGNLKVKRILRVDKTNILFSDYQVSTNGILTAFLGNAYGADVYWWRVDKLLNVSQLGRSQSRRVRQ